MSMQGKIKKKLMVVLFVIAFSARCLAATDRIINRNADLAFQPNTEESSSTQVTGQSTLQQSEAGSALRRFQTELRQSIRLLKDEIEEVSKKAARRRKREQDESAIPDMIALHRATEIFEIVNFGVAYLRMSPNTLGVKIQQTTGGGLEIVSGDRSYVLSMPRLSRPVTPSEFPFAMTTRQNSAAAMKAALDNCRRAAQPRLLPNEIISANKAEHERYQEIRRLADTAEKLRLRALRDLKKITDQPALLREKTREWEEVVGEAVKKARSTLVDLRNIPARPTYRVEPLGYTIIKQPMSSTAKPANEVQLAVDVRVQLDYFLPVVEEYGNLMELYNFRRSRVSGSSRGSRRRSARRSATRPAFRLFNLRIFDSIRYRLVLEDGRYFLPTEFLDPDSWGGYLLDSIHFKTKIQRQRRSVKNHRCIIGYNERETIHPTLDIRLQWVLDVNDCKPPFKLQFAEFTPIFVPDNRLEAPPVDELPQDSSHDTPVVSTRTAGKKAALIVASQNFRDEELFETKRALDAAAVQTVIASTRIGIIRGALGNIAEANILVGQLRVENFDAIVFIGGPGAVEYVANPAALNLAREAVRQRKILAAIDTAPTILANAGVLTGVRATSFLSERNRLILSGAIYTGIPVEQDRLIITSSGPAAAIQFGRAIADALTGR